MVHGSSKSKVGTALASRRMRNQAVVSETSSLPDIPRAVVERRGDPTSLVSFKAGLKRLLGTSEARVKTERRFQDWSKGVPSRASPLTTASIVPDKPSLRVNSKRSLSKSHARRSRDLESHSTTDNETSILPHERHLMSDVQSSASTATDHDAGFSNTGGRQFTNEGHDTSNAPPSMGYNTHQYDPNAYDLYDSSYSSTYDYSQDPASPSAASLFDGPDPTNLTGYGTSAYNVIDYGDSLLTNQANTSYNNSDAYNSNSDKFYKTNIDTNQHGSNTDGLYNSNAYTDQHSSSTDGYHNLNATRRFNDMHYSHTTGLLSSSSSLSGALGPDTMSSGTNNSYNHNTSPTSGYNSVGLPDPRSNVSLDAHTSGPGMSSGYTSDRNANASSAGSTSKDYATPGHPHSGAVHMQHSLTDGSTTIAKPGAEHEPRIIVMTEANFRMSKPESITLNAVPAPGHPQVPPVSAIPIKKGRKRALDENDNPKPLQRKTRLTRAKVQKEDGGAEEPKKKKRKTKG